jgi:hypothetical protein
MGVGSVVEQLQGQIAELVSERQVLRAFGASRSSLEQNRRELVGRQWALSQALIEQHTNPGMERTDRSL